MNSDENSESANFYTPSVSVTEESLHDAAKHLAQTERGQLALQGLRTMLDSSYSLDSKNIQAILTLLSGFYGSFTGTASDAINDHLEAK